MVRQVRRDCGSGRDNLGSKGRIADSRTTKSISSGKSSSSMVGSTVSTNTNSAVSVEEEGG